MSEVNVTVKAKDEASSALNQAASSANSFADSISKLDARFKEVIDSSQKFTDSTKNIREFGQAFSSSVSVPIAAAGAAFGALIGFTTASADSIDKLSQRLAISSTALQELQFAASQSGVEFSNVESAATQFAERLTDIVDGNNDVARSFSQLDVSITDASGSLRASGDIFDDTIVALSGMEDVAERNRIAFTLFGENAANLAPLLNQGSAGIAELRARAIELGIVLDEQAISGFVQFGDSVAEVRSAFTVLRNDIATAFLPILVNDLIPLINNTIIPGIQGFADIIVSLVTRFTELNSTTQAVFLAIAGSLAIGGPLIVGFANLVSSINLVVSAFNALRNVGLLLALSNPIGWVALGVASVATLTGIFVGLKNALNDNLSASERISQQYDDEMTPAINEAIASIQTNPNSLNSVLTSLATNMGTNATEAANTFIEGLDGVAVAAVDAAEAIALVNEINRQSQIINELRPEAERLTGIKSELESTFLSNIAPFFQLYGVTLTDSIKAAVLDGFRNLDFSRIPAEELGIPAELLFEITSSARNARDEFGNNIGDIVRQLNPLIEQLYAAEVAIDDATVRLLELQNRIKEGDGTVTTRTTGSGTGGRTDIDNQKTALDLARETYDRWQATTLAAGQFNDRLEAANNLIRLLREEQAGLDEEAADYSLRYAELNDEIIDVTRTIDDLYRSNSSFTSSLLEFRTAFQEASRLDLNVEENRVEFNRAAESYAAAIQRAINATPFAINDETGIEFVGILNSELENLRATQASVNIEAQEFSRILEANQAIEFAEQFGTADEQVASYTNKLNILFDIQDRLEQQNLQATRAYIDNARAITEANNAIINVRNEEISGLDTQIQSYLALGDTQSALDALAQKSELLNNLQSEAASLGIDTLGIQVRIRDNEREIRNIRAQSIQDEIDLLQLQSQLADNDQDRINLTNKQLSLYNELKNLYEEGSKDQLRTQAEINAATQRQIDLEENQLLTRLENARLTGDQTEIRQALANLTFFYENSLDAAERNTDSWNELNQKYRQARTELLNLLSTSNQLINIDIPFSNLQRQVDPLINSVEELIDVFNRLADSSNQPPLTIPSLRQRTRDFLPVSQEVTNFIEQSKQTREELVRNIGLLKEQRSELENQPEALRENVRLTQQLEDSLAQLDSSTASVTSSFRNLIGTLFTIGSGYSLAEEAQQALSESTNQFFNRVSQLDLSEIVNLRNIFDESIFSRVETNILSSRIRTALSGIIRGSLNSENIELISDVFNIPEDSVFQFVSDLQLIFGDVEQVITEVYRQLIRNISENNEELTNRLAILEIVIDQAEIDADYSPFNSEQFFNIQQLKQTGKEYTSELKGFILGAETDLQDLIRNRDFGRFNLTEEQLSQLTPEVRSYYEQFQEDLDSTINQLEIDIYNARQELEQLLREPLQAAGTTTGQFEEIFRLSTGGGDRESARNALQQSIQEELDLIASEEQRIRGVSSQDEYRNALKIRRLELLRLETELINETRLAELNAIRASTSFFSEFARLTGDTSDYIAALEEEYAALIIEQSRYTEGSEEWRELQLEILGNRDALQNLNDEAERQSVQKAVESINAAQNSFNQVFGLVGEFADALGVSVENLQAIQDLSNNVFGIFSNLASGNIFGAIISGLRAIATLLRFTSASKEIAKSLKSGILEGVRGAFSEAIETGNIKDFQDALRRNIYRTVLDSIINAIINARVIEGALGKSLSKLSKEIAKGNVKGVRDVLNQIDEDITTLFEELGPVFAEISAAFSNAINGTVDRAEQRTESLESASFVFGEFVSQAVSIPLLDASYIFQSSVMSFGAYVDRLVTTGIQVNSTVNVNQSQAPMAMTAY